MSDRCILLFSSRTDGLGLVNFIGLGEVSAEQVQQELSQLFLTGSQYLGNRGLIYCQQLDCYLYIRLLPGDSNNYVLSSLQISSSISFYYNVFQADLKFDSIFNDEVLEKFISSRSLQTELLREWRGEFTKLSPEHLPNVYSDEYDDELVTFYVNTFGSNLPELFYAMLLQIPIIHLGLDVLERNRVASIYSQLLHYLHVYEGHSTKGVFAQVFLVDEFQPDQFKEYLLVTNSGEISTRFHDPPLDGIDTLVNEALEYHWDRIMPFQVGVYTNLFWNIQKIYGALAMHQGKIDFSRYLYSDKLHFVPLLVKLFNKISFLQNYTISSS